ncbi:Uncharacterised protein [Escherichia coli]|uniref:Uncharacterized protein n=1 Tax=Escherichia coli TaxID=562 RepID=A0A376DDX9_ECOLX|nr:Uncharacterised protein [Escherichia coli]
MAKPGRFQFFQVIHRTEEDRFFAVGVEVGTVIPPDIQATVRGSVGLESYVAGSILADRQP